MSYYAENTIPNKEEATASPATRQRDDIALESLMKTLPVVMFIIAFIAASPFVSQFMLDWQDFLTPKDSSTASAPAAGPLVIIEFIPVALVLAYADYELVRHLMGCQEATGAVKVAQTIARWTIGTIAAESIYLHTLVRFFSAYIWVAGSGTTGSSSGNDLLFSLMLYAGPAIAACIVAALVYRGQRITSCWHFVTALKGHSLVSIIMMAVFFPILSIVLDIALLLVSALLMIVLPIFIMMLIFPFARAATYNM